jgi:hypothetical protein
MDKRFRETGIASSGHLLVSDTDWVRHESRDVQSIRSR